MRKLLHFATGIALLAAVPLAAQDDPAALVIRLQGTVQVRHGSDAPTAATVGERLMVGDELIPESGARATLITRTGATQQVTEATTLTAPTGGGNPDMFQRAMATLAQAASTDATAGGRQGMIRPIPGQTTLVAPRNELTVQSDRPTFTWTNTPGQSYELMLRKLDSPGRPTVYDVGTDTTWAFPETEDALEPGAKYSWTVFVGGRQGGRALPPQEFKVIDFEKSLELIQFMDDITAFGLDPMTDGLFLTVVAFRDLELFYDADQAMDGIEGQGAMSADMYMLKGEILSVLGHEDAARAAFDQADALMR